jgi:hypothetical protein
MFEISHEFCATSQQWSLLFFASRNKKKQPASFLRCSVYEKKMFFHVSNRLFLIVYYGGWKMWIMELSELTAQPNDS